MGRTIHLVRVIHLNTENWAIIGLANNGRESRRTGGVGLDPDGGGGVADPEQLVDRFAAGLDGGTGGRVPMDRSSQIRGGTGSQSGQRWRT